MTEQDDAEPGGGDQPQPGESWTNPVIAEFSRRKDELMAMPGYELKVDLEGLGRAGRVIYNNAQELVRHAGLFLNSGRHVNQMTDEYEDELVRFLHNYLASVFSLIEVQRVVMRHRWGDKSAFETGDYTKRRKAAFETGEAEFMKDLRNYCTHRSIPVPDMVTTLFGKRGRPPRFVNELKLDRDELLTWEEWTAPARAYLEAKEPQFDLLPVIESYMTAASKFFNWFTEEINRRCAEIRDEYLTAAMALRRWYEDETGLSDEFVHGPAPRTPGQRGQHRAAERRQRKSKGR